ncbi:hypothetical protein BBK14_33880 [Parafrankia soli]|uniref:Uncharacterized protein n=1 Tax=Parafrankia soli TaxID=2599596 RepID=A0A1S1QGT9_9ACTN|nr:hypothetical protein [Parafrankia soli]OHV31504.1 hypothetical protein BBK14_33880 [Parafrankia soli]
MDDDREFESVRQDLLGEQRSMDINRRIMGIDSRDPLLADRLYHDPDIIGRGRRLAAAENRRAEYAGEALNWLTGNGSRPQGDG